MKRYKRTVSGVTTVEMAYIMPVVLLIFLMVVYATFYFHDKQVLAGMAYETAVIGAQQERLPKGMDTGQLTEFFQTHTQRKLIMMTNPGVSVTKDESYVLVQATANRRSMRLKVQMKAIIMEPEKYIRMIRKLK